MKVIIAPLFLIASIGLSSAETLDRAHKSSELGYDGISGAPPVPSHVGQTSYVGYYFSSKPSNCSVLIWAKPDNETPAEKTTHHQVRIDLKAKQAITFFADDLGSNLCLERSADAKRLSVRQTSISLTQ